MLPKNGGVIMVTFVPGFVSPKVNAWNKLQTAEQDRLKAAFPNDPAAVKAGVDKWTAANPAPAATISDVADHVDHIRKTAGIDHLGIGGDFDGISQTVKDLDNVSTYPRLTAELLTRGYGDADIRKILGQNILRVMREAEKVSRRLQAERGPSVAVMTQAAPAAAPAAEPVEITLQRTTCFGTCPEYTVTLIGDGTVTYSGRQFVRTPGQHTWKIDPAAVRGLARDMESAGFFDLKDEYTSLITDNPTTYTTLKVGSRAKKVKNYVTGPVTLKDIEAKIDEVSGVRKYVSPDGKLVYSIETGDADGVRALLAAGANVKVVDEDGVTLVMRAAAAGNAETVRLLLAAGADPTARDRHGRNAADRARDGLADSAPKQYKLILLLLTDE